MTRIAFDIGGVLSKYPDILRPFAKSLVDGGAWVAVITDMQPLDLVIETLQLNALDFIPNIFSADYATHGEGCKAELARELAIDILLDDHIGYVAEPSCAIRCLVMPDATRPYYHESWKVVGAEGGFGRNSYNRARAARSGDAR